MIVVDSSAWIDFLNGGETRQVARVEEALRRFDVEPMLDPGLAVLAARHHRRLRGLGVTVRKTIGLNIATFCIARGHALLTADRGFQPMARHLGLALA